MAVIVCGNCGKQISSLVTVCPHCGAPVSSQQNNGMYGQQQYAQPQQFGQQPMYGQQPNPYGVQTAPKKSSGKVILIVVLVVLALACIGAGIAIPMLNSGNKDTQNSGGDQNISGSSDSSVQNTTQSTTQNTTQSTTQSTGSAGSTEAASSQSEYMDMSYTYNSISGEYHGYVKNGQPQGAGYFKGSGNGATAVIRGEWSDGILNDYVELCYIPDDNPYSYIYYYAPAKNNVPNGEGIIIISNDSIRAQGTKYIGIPASFRGEDNVTIGNYMMDLNDKQMVVSFDSSYTASVSEVINYIDTIPDALYAFYENGTITGTGRYENGKVAEPGDSAYIVDEVVMDAIKSKVEARDYYGLSSELVKLN